MNQQNTQSQQTEQHTKNEQDIASLSFEQARQELINIVKTLENDQSPLEETMELWERGESLVNHCQQILKQASERISAAQTSATEEN